MDTVKPGLTAVLEILEGTVNENPHIPRNFLTAQTIEHFCKEIDPSVEKGSVYSHYGDGVLSRQSNVDSSVQKVKPASSRALVLFMAHYPVLASHPAEGRLYDVLPR